MQIRGYFYCSTEAQAKEAAETLAFINKATVPLPEGCQWLPQYMEQLAVVTELGEEFYVNALFVRLGFLEFLNGIVGWSATLIPLTS